MKAKNIVLNLVSSYAHIILSVIVNVAYVPIALQFMGVERYGIWIVIQTIINYLVLANFGIPTAVTNLMSQAGTNEEKSELLLRGFKILSIFCSAVLILSLISYWFISNYTSWMGHFSQEIKQSILILLSFFIIRIPFQMSSSSFTANGKIYISKIYELLTIIITFISLIIAAFFQRDLVFLAVLSGSATLIIQVGGFFHSLSILKIKSISTKKGNIKNKNIYGPGFSLFAAGVGSLIIWNTDNLVVSRYLGFKEVAMYSTAFRLFSLGITTFGLIYGILIPYYGNFFKHRAWYKLREMFYFILILVPLMASCVWLLLWMFSRDIIMLWLGDDKLYAGSNLFFVLGAYGFIFANIGCMFNLLTSLNQLKALFWLSIGEALCNLLASIFFVQLFGMEGVALATLLAATIVPFLMLPFLINSNKELNVPFPFYRFLGNTSFYFIILAALFLLEVCNWNVHYKLFVAVSYILFVVSFQYLMNKKIVIGAVKSFVE